jgi:iron-sulfur cluster assembly accessory protein
MTTDAVLNAPDLSLTAAAAQRIADLSRLEGRPLMLRIGVDAGGCSGFQYQFDLVEAAAPDDLRIERDGAAALVDEISLVLLKGSEIDFVDELAGAEFRIRNPNARSSCGCGVSFSI